ncbi:MAG: hypothetical protein JNK61_06280 [Bacteroidia bacterium]|nr:hypothetical protein [Bacteroidia bacterium]
MKLTNKFLDKKNFELADSSSFKNIAQLNKHYYETGNSHSMRFYALAGLNKVQQFLPLASSDANKKVLRQFEMLFNRQAGISYFEDGDYTNQLKYFQQFLVAAQKLNSINDIATAYTYIATCHRELEDYHKSFELAKKAVYTLSGCNYPATLATAYALISNYYLDEKDNTDSVYYYRKKAYLLFKETNNTMLLASSAFDLVEFFHHIGQTDSCKKYLAEVEHLIAELQNPEQTIIYNCYMAQVELMEGNTNQAVTLLQKARSLADETIELNDNSQINRNLALALAAAGKTGDAFKVLESAFNEYSADLNTDKVRSLTQAQMNFDFEKERAIAAIELKREKQQRNFLIVLASVLLLFAGFIFQRYRERHRTIIMLAEKNETIEKAYSDLKEAQQALIDTEKQREAQNIRVRIARDIHDEIGSGLTKITLLSDVAKKKTQQTDVANALSKITSFSKNVSTSLSEIVWAINPGNDTVDSLINYLKSTAANLLDDSGLNYTLHFPLTESGASIHPEIKRNIYLVMKEALNNTLKYAHAKTLAVTFEVNEQTFYLEVQDDGVGFNLDAETPNKNGNGLLNMQLRMAQHKNTLRIISSPGNGCKIIAKGKLT